jgi:hypothetical protein
MLPSERDKWSWDVRKNEEKLWGIRMKEHMRGLSYQRCSENQKIFPVLSPGPVWEIPSVINVAHNGAFGPQNGEI